MQGSKSFIPLLLALFCIGVWGLSYPVTRSAVQQIPPLTLACFRFFAAAALLWPLTRRYRQPLAPADRKWVWALALSGVTFYFAFENFGLKLTTASHGALIIATVPLGTELVAARRVGQWPRRGAWLGAVAALSGIGLLVGFDGGASSTWGDLLMFGAVGSWIAYTFLLERIAGRYPNLLLTRWIMLAGAVALAPGAAVEMWLVPFSTPTLLAWGQFLFLAVACSALAYDAWNRAVPALGPTAVNNLLYLIPLVGVAGGILFLGEPATPSLLIGGGLIFGGVYLARQNK